MLRDVPCPEPVLVVAGAVFRNINRFFQQFVYLPADLHDALGINFPSQIIHGTVFRRPIRGPADGRPGVIVDPMEVAELPWHNAGVLPDGKRRPPGAHGLGEAPLEQFLHPLGPEPLERIFGVLGREGPQMVGHPHPGILVPHLQPRLPDEPIGLDVGGRHIGHHPAHFQKALPSRRPCALQIPVVSINIRLVDGNILADQIPHALHHFPHEAQEIGDVVPLSEAASFLQPQRVAEMVEGQQHGDPRLLQRLDLLPVMGDGLLVKKTVLGLDAAPFHSHAVALDAHVLHERQIFLPPLVVIHSRRRVAVVLDAALAVPVIPVAVFVAALDLGSGGGRAQEQAVLQLKLHCISSPRRRSRRSV